MHRKFLDVQISWKFILRYFVTVIPGGYVFIRPLWVGSARYFVAVCCSLV